ncbi:MAG: hypothetical protein ACLSGS_04490, partial [Adlercreutzia sp.]
LRFARVRRLPARPRGGARLDGRQSGHRRSENGRTMAGEPAADGTRRGVGIFNLGTDTGSSVLDVVHSFERACGRELPYQIKPRRAGDVAVNYAACDGARRAGLGNSTTSTACAPTDGAGSRRTRTYATMGLTESSTRPRSSRHMARSAASNSSISSAILRIARHPDAQAMGTPTGWGFCDQRAQSLASPR